MRPEEEAKLMAMTRSSSEEEVKRMVEDPAYARKVQAELKEIEAEIESLDEEEQQYGDHGSSDACSGAGDEQDDARQLRDRESHRGGQNEAPGHAEVRDRLPCARKVQELGHGGEQEDGGKGNAQGDEYRVHGAEAVSGNARSTSDESYLPGEPRRQA